MIYPTGDPISLHITDYKIFSEVIACRIKSALPKIRNISKKGYLKGMCGQRFGQFHKKSNFFIFDISLLQGLVKKTK